MSKPWQLAELRTALEMARDGRSARDIAGALDRSCASVTSRLNLHGLGLGDRVRIERMLAAIDSGALKMERLGWLAWVGEGA